MKTEARNKNSKGLWEAAGAILAMVAVGLIIAGAMLLLTGCAGGEALVKYGHRSSIPDYYDLNTSDTLGVCFDVRLCTEERCGAYAPRMEGCVNYEIHDDPVYGRDPSGEISIRQPFKVW